MHNRDDEPGIRCRHKYAEQAREKPKLQLLVRFAIARSNGGDSEPAHQQLDNCDQRPQMRHVFAKDVQGLFHGKSIQAAWRRVLASAMKISRKGMAFTAIFRALGNTRRIW